MLGTRAAGKLTGSTLTLELAGKSAALRTGLESTLTTRSAGAAGTLEYGASTLDAGVRASASRRSNHGSRRWSLVHGTRPGLRHNHLADLHGRRNGHGSDRFGCRRFGCNCGGSGRCGSHFSSHRRRRLDRRRSSRCLALGLNEIPEHDGVSYCPGREGDGYTVAGLFDSLCRRRCNDDRLSRNYNGWGGGGCDHSGRGGRYHRRSRRTDDHSPCRRCYGHGGAHGDGARRRTRDHRASWWTRRNRRSRRRNDVWSLPRLRNDLARFWPSSYRRYSHHTRRRRTGCSTSNWTGNHGCARRSRVAGCLGPGRTRYDHSTLRTPLCSLRPLRILRRALCLLLFRQNRLQHISRFGDIRQINLRLICLLGTRTRRRRRTRPTLKMRAHLLCLTRLDGTRVSLAVRHIHVFQSVENLFTLDFQLARQIVNSNLTHPPLFVGLPTAC